METIDYSDLPEAVSDRFPTIRYIVLGLAGIVVPFVVGVLVGTAVDSEMVANVVMGILYGVAVLLAVRFIINRIVASKKLANMQSAQLRSFAARNGWMFEDRSYDDLGEADPVRAVLNDRLSWKSVYAVQGDGRRPFTLSILVGSRATGGGPALNYVTVLRTSGTKHGYTTNDSKIRITDIDGATYVSVDYNAYRRREMKSLFETAGIR